MSPGVDTKAGFEPLSGDPPPRDLHFVVPGTLDRATGGDRYDARLVSGLRERGWSVGVHGIGGGFPRSDAEAEKALEDALREIPDGSRVVVDGLVLGALPDPAHRHADRLGLLALVHHPLADETGRGEEERAAYRDSEQRALAAVDGVIVTSPHTADRLHRAFGVPEDRIRVVVPGTDPAPRARGPASGEPSRLLSVGSLIPRKGQDVLIAALRRIRDLEWTLVCVGSPAADPEYARSVREMASDPVLRHRITFPGRVSEERLNQLFHTSSLFVLPSHYEGYGMALAEALARGLPVVSTTGGAIPDTVPAGAGVLVPPDDPEALAGALAPLLEASGANRLSEMSRVARSHGVLLPTWEQAAESLERAVRALAPESPPTGEGS